MLGSRSANFYDLHRVNQVVQQKNNNKENTKTSTRKNEKEGECLLRLKKKKTKKNSAQFALTQKHQVLL